MALGQHLNPDRAQDPAPAPGLARGRIQAQNLGHSRVQTLDQIQALILDQDRVQDEGAGRESPDHA